MIARALSTACDLRASAQLTLRLVAEKGFRAGAVEAERPDAYRVNCSSAAAVTTRPVASFRGASPRSRTGRVRQLLRKPANPE